ncbi:hypothetical protein ACQP2F_21710 [Actinoplanes sp. CA-030573]|uniref:hypothetical protein n=1 Tax=Actinoplanes sp. CA-030573 TaxID=3239898 RepID=UPI003D92C0AC
MKRLLPWLVAALLFGLAVPVGLAGVDDGPWGFVLPVLAVAVAAPLFLVLHECGHLLAAVALRLRVTGVRMRPRSYVRVRPGLDGPALPVRFVAFYLAGPVVDLGLAAGLSRGAFAAGPALLGHCLLACALVGVLSGVGNLWPRRLPAGWHTDGSNAVSWAVHPAREMAALRAAEVVPR